MGPSKPRNKGLTVGVVIPFHNEEEFLPRALDSWVSQSIHPDRLVLVDDRSTDGGRGLAADYAKRHEWIQLIDSYPSESGEESMHLPGPKVVRAFYSGYGQLPNCDLIGKFDADIELPPNYLEVLLSAFAGNPSLGACAGELYVPATGGEWIREPISNPGHVRGPVKLYRRACFKAIGGLKHSLGWDTVDVLLARYHGYAVSTLPELRVRHLRPTGLGYSRKSDLERGMALYRMRYDPVLSTVAALKMGMNAGSLKKAGQVLNGYWSARFDKAVHPFVSREEGAFIRKFRWKGILGRLRKA